MQQQQREGYLTNEKVQKMLQKNIGILKLENRYISRIDLDVEIKFEWFEQTSCDLTNKLNALRDVANSHQILQDKIKHFTDQISNLWLSFHKQIREKYLKIRMASNTSPGVPLSTILQAVKKETVLIKQSIENYKSLYSADDLAHIWKLFSELERLINNLEACDHKLQQYLCISKLTPQLLKLESLIDMYISDTLSLPKEKSKCTDLGAFSILVMLLTGELLGEEPISPDYILAENIPKKPVFIIRNIKR